MYQLFRPDLTLNTTDTALCTGSDIQLEVNSMQGAVYNWSPSDGLTNSTIASPVASIDSSIIYQIGVSSLNLINGDSLYCFVKDSIQIDVYPNIQPIVNGDTVYCAGAGLLTISNAINFTDFIWAYESTFDSVVSQADSFVFEEILSTWIYISLTDSFGCPQIDSVQMVNGSIVHNVSDTIFNCLYDSLFIETGIQDSFVLQYDWYLDGVPLNGMDIDTVVFPPGQSGELQLAYQTIYNCEDTLTIDIEMAPDFVYILPKDLIFCDSVIQFQLPGILNTPVVYNMEGTAIDPSQLGFYIDTLLSTETYYLQFTDSVGCVYTDSIDVDLDMFNASLWGDTIICQGVDTLSIDISEDGIYEIVWSEDATIIEQIDSTTIIVAPQQTNNYSAIVRSQSGCTDTVETTVIFLTNPVLIDLQPSADTIFDGQSLLISSLYDTNYQYQWYVEDQLVNNNSSSIEYNLNQSGFVVLQVTDQRGCVGLDTAWIFYISTECDNQTVFTPNAFTPDGDGVNDHWQPFSNSLVAYTYRIYDRWGNCVYDSDKEPGGWNGVYKGQRLRPDVYGFVLLGTCIDGAEYVKKGNITLIR